MIKDNKILSQISKAQYYSDRAKGISYKTGEPFWHYYNISYNNRKYLYGKKDSHLMAAIRMIVAKNGKSNIHFYVTLDNTLDSYLVYFNFKLNGERHQVSFHSYNSLLSSYLENNKHKTNWNNHLSSRETCHLIDEYCSK